MRRLYFLRHGKSDWDAAFGGDHERPLAKRGRNAAELVGRVLATLEEVPDKILTSSAERARRTVELAVQAGGWSSVVEICDDLYACSPEAVLARVLEQPDDVRSLLVAGHEPAWSETVGRLIGDAEIRFPTAALARVDVAAARWQDVAWGSGTLQWLLPPRLLERLLGR